MDIANTGGAEAAFDDGQKIFEDTMPTSDVSYAGAAVSDETGIGGTGIISCSLATNVITCTASGGTVTLAATTGGFRVTTTATPSAVGTFTNPTGGDCEVDPDEHITESDETDNDCNSDAVVVLGPVRYVTKIGSDAANNCYNPATPCLTITHAVDVADPGDIIDIGAGTYDEAPPTLIIDKALEIRATSVIVK